ncbi:MAG: FAD-dependent oxidoreductase [Halioglobus sp.]
MKKRVVIAGFGDTGLLVAIHLGGDCDIVGISPKPCLVSGQELGTRLTRPQAWKQDYLMPYRRYKHLDEVRTVQGLVSVIDTANGRVTVRLDDGSEQHEPYDVLVISSGASNGFWRDNAIEDLASINGKIDDTSRQMEQAESFAVIGGGATGVSAAANLAARFPTRPVQLFYSQEQPLPGYHPRVRKSLKNHLRKAGVHLHPGHRAKIPDGFNCDTLTSAPIEFSSGQEAVQSDLTLWAIGKRIPHNDFIPADMLNKDGYVKADSFLRVEGHDNVFTVGDIAATDPNRSSARNWGYRLLAHNIRAYLKGEQTTMKHYSAPPYRWGSILGVQANGLRVFQPDGRNFRFPRWTIKSLLFPLAVHRMIYKGVRKAR